jgi:enoyl-CoA hydratase/carnithine racemase
MKKLLHAPNIEAISDALDRENQALQTLFTSSDFAEGLTARVERRPPVFKGK